MTLAAVLVGLLAWRFGGTSGQQANPVPLVKKPSAARTRPPAVSQQARRAPVRRTTPRPTVTPALARVVLTASNGRSWLDARQGSATGKQLYIGVLEQGQTTRVQGSRLWIRLGAPAALTATLNGRRVVLPSATSNIVVTPGGIKSG